MVDAHQMITAVKLLARAGRAADAFSLPVAT
jgi:hypothetical protein